MNNALVLTKVVKRYGDFTAVNGISLNVPKGSVYGFLGPNGAGKTTTIRMIMNITKPDEGSIKVFGQTSGEETKARIGYLPEERGVYKKMKVLDLIQYFGRLKGKDPKQIRTRALELLDSLELSKWAGSKCQDLSKGMQQKVQFISTIVHEPELVILDEPFSGLDPVNVEVVKDMILELRRRGTTVLFSTHIMDQAEKLCDSVVLINRGEIVIDGPLSEVKSSSVAEEAIIVEYDGSGDLISQNTRVARMNDFGKYMEVYLKPGSTPQEFLSDLVGKVSVRRFEVRHPTLNEIFIRSVRGEDAAATLPEEVTV
ncbi:MAG: ATP-binding cassette domain-containing protein [Candidatus Eisenbacteria bacterium]|uniref:ATP-binding cassette domain-containing protein n=1 Tax=Eiseniibacteriota bacterium TaxID=2212470 RepID=A0A7Y2E727_UNCEI|nr:ATP-binding cassette domain-containing protein [Candidatus Eisenbacteria bacterium]